MNCRYCGSVYGGEDRTCGGCGAPKGALARTLLDAPSTPEHWSNSFWRTAMRVFIVTVGVIAALTALDWLGVGEPATVAAFFWAVPVAPALLSYAAWREAEANWLRFLPYMGMATAISMAVGVTMLFAIGMIYVNRETFPDPGTPLMNAPLDQGVTRK